MNNKKNELNQGKEFTETQNHFHIPHELWVIIISKYCTLSAWLALTKTNKFFSSFIATYIFSDHLNTLSIKFSTFHNTDEKELFDAWWHTVNKEYLLLRKEEKKQFIAFAYQLDPQTLAVKLYTSDVKIPEYPTNLLYAQKREYFFQNLHKFHHMIPQYWLDDVFVAIKDQLELFDEKQLLPATKNAISFFDPLKQPIKHSKMDLVEQSWVYLREFADFNKDTTLLDKLTWVKHFDYLYSALLCQQSAEIISEIIINMSFSNNRNNYWLINFYYKNFKPYVPCFQLAIECTASIKVLDAIYNAFTNRGIALPNNFTTSQFSCSFYTAPFYTNSITYYPSLLQGAIDHHHLQQMQWFLDRSNATALSTIHIVLSLNNRYLITQIDMLVMLGRYGVPFTIEYKELLLDDLTLEIKNLLSHINNNPDDHLTAFLTWLIQQHHRTNDVVCILNQSALAIEKTKKSSIDNIHPDLKKYFIEKGIISSDDIATHVPHNTHKNHTSSKKLSYETTAIILDEHEQIAAWQTRDENGIYPIHQAASQGDWSTIAKQIKLISDVLSFVDQEGHLPLHYVAMYCVEFYQHEASWELLCNARDLSAKNISGKTPLMCAVTAENTDFIHTLLNSKHANKLNINEQDFSGNTALHYAIESGNTKCVSMLVDFGADIHSVNKKKKTALMLSIENQNINMAKICDPFKNHDVSLIIQTQKVAETLWPTWHNLANKVKTFAQDQYLSQFVSPTLVIHSIRNFLSSLYHHRNTSALTNHHDDQDTHDLPTQLRQYKTQSTQFRKIHPFRPQWLTDDGKTWLTCIILSAILSICALVILTQSEVLRGSETWQGIKYLFGEWTTFSTTIAVMGLCFMTLKGIHYLGLPICLAIYNAIQFSQAQHHLHALLTEMEKIYDTTQSSRITESTEEEEIYDGYDADKTFPLSSLKSQHNRYSRLKDIGTETQPLLLSSVQIEEENVNKANMPQI